ncbi:MAG TPA: PRC-barrel domain-containing protein [Herpetosiphonaceae bacterium]
MYKAKALIGKAIIQQATGEQIATVRDILLDRDTTGVLALLVGGGWLSGPKVVRWSAVVNVGDVLLVNDPQALIAAKDDPAISAELSGSSPLTGTTVISESGERIGEIGDLYLDERGNVTGYEVKQGLIRDLAGRKFLPIERVQTVGQDAVIAEQTDLQSARAAEREAGGS